MPRISNSVLVEESFRETRKDLPSLDRFTDVLAKRAPTLVPRSMNSKRELASDILTNIGEDLSSTLYSLVDLKSNAQESGVRLQAVKILLGIHGITEKEESSSQNANLVIQINGSNTNVGAILIPDRGNYDS